jgi:hypothetical protein
MNKFDYDVETSPTSGAPIELNWYPSSGADWSAPLYLQPSKVFDRNLFATSGNYPLYMDVSRVSGTAHAAPEKARPSREQIVFEAQRERLISAIRDMIDSSPNWSGETSKISDGSAKTAENFLRCLSDRNQLPKIAADGEGDVMLVWEDGGISCIVTVEPKLLHLISKPGGRGARRIDAQRFLGVQIPPTILRQIPVK